MKTTFVERSPRPIAVVSLAVIALLLALGLFAGSLPFVSPSENYAAYFTNSAGLVSGDSVRIAGVPVGTVTDVELDGQHVRVEFEVDDEQRLGERASAAIRLQTFLGTKFLAVDPAGGGELDEPIPVTRTSVPYDLPQALSQFGDTVTAIDTPTLAQSLDELSTTLAATAPELGSLLDNLAAFSQSITGQDTQISSLLRNTRTVSQTLAERDEQVVAAMADADLFFDALVRRREALSRLLDDVRAASAQISGLLADNRAQLDPLLDRLHTTAQLLEANLPALDAAIRQFAPAARYIANATGDGRWLDLYFQNLGPFIAGGFTLPESSP